MRASKNLYISSFQLILDVASSIYVAFFPGLIDAALLFIPTLSYLLWMFFDLILKLIDINIYINDLCV